MVFAAIAPDLDLLLRFWDGANHHQQESHSVGAAVLAGLVSAVIFGRAGWKRPLRLALAVTGAWLSHVLLDYLNRDTNPPIGLMALWPFSSDYYKFPWPIFLDVGRTLTLETLRNNLLAAAWEALVLLPVFSVAWRVRIRRLGLS